jgi:hypothetical protein
MNANVRPAPVARRAEAVARRGTASEPRHASPRLAEVWSDTVATLAVHGPGMLGLALLGGAGSAVLGLAIALSFGDAEFVQVYLHATGPFATWGSLGRIEPSADNRLFTHLLAQAACGFVITAFARGAITALALHCRAIRLRPACYLAARRLPPLLAGAALYAALVGCGSVGANAALSRAGLDLSNAGQRAITLEGAAGVIVVRGLDALVPDPGSPVAEFVPYARHVAFTPLQPANGYVDPASYASGTPTVDGVLPRDRSHEVPALASLSVLLFLAGETILRFRTVAALTAPGLIRPLLRSAGWGLAHAPIVLAHGLAWRAAMLGVSLVAVIVPIALVQCFGAGVLRVLGLPEGAISLPGMIAAAACVNGILTAAGAVYDARLYRALAARAGAPSVPASVPQPRRTAATAAVRQQPSLEHPC